MFINLPGMSLIAYDPGIVRTSNKCWLWRTTFSLIHLYHFFIPLFSAEHENSENWRDEIEIDRAWKPVRISCTKAARTLLHFIFSMLGYIPIAWVLHVKYIAANSPAHSGPGILQLLRPNRLNYSWRYNCPAMKMHLWYCRPDSS